MSRSKWKGPFIYAKHLHDLKKFKKQKTKNKETVIVTRNSEIVPAFVGSTVNIHNGKNHVEIVVSENMIGHKFGEFAFTRSRFLFKKKKQKK